MSRKIKTIKVKKIWTDRQWAVRFGWLNPGRGRPPSVARLFKVVGEKLPFEALGKVDGYMRAHNLSRKGVYIAHDSMGYARYIGRGEIFLRLRARLKGRELQLKYFSFYVVEERKHVGELETLLIRAAGPLLHYNTKKKRVTVSTGGLLDYEAGTQFFELRSKRGNLAEA